MVASSCRVLQLLGSTASHLLHIQDFTAHARVFIRVLEMADGGNHDCGSLRGGGSGGGVMEQNWLLPIANISHIMKKIIPANSKIAKDTKETLQECIYEFISFVISEASDKCQKEKHKSINRDFLLWAIATLGFEEYVDPLKIYMHKYRE